MTEYVISFLTNACLISPIQSQLLIEHNGSVLFDEQEYSMRKELHIPVDSVTLSGDLQIPDDAKGVVIFSHGSGSSRKSPRNRSVAGMLVANGFATLLFDLLTPEEELDYSQRFNIELLAHRLVVLTEWLHNKAEYSALPIGYFGASTGAASALMAAVSIGPALIKAVVSRGGRPDLATEALAHVQSPTLLLVGDLDTEVIQLNRQAYQKIVCKKELLTISGASHLFEEPGKLEQVTRYASDWFTTHMYKQKQIDVEKDFFD